MAEEGWAPAALLEELATALRDLNADSGEGSKETESAGRGASGSRSRSNSKENARNDGPQNLNAMLADDSDAEPAANLSLSRGTPSRGTQGQDPASAMLSLRENDTVVILLRHYSGWCYCRHIEGSQKEGWVADSYLKPYGSKDSLQVQPFIQKVKKFRVIGESLHKVIEIAEYADTAIGQILVSQGEKLSEEQTDYVSAVIEHLTGEVGGGCLCTGVR